MSLNFVDLVVLGDDLSGILAGSLLAKRGLSVLVVDRQTSDYSVSLPGLETRLFKSLLGKLSIPQSQIRRLSKNDISFQVILPNHRIDVTPDREHLLEEMDREFPSHTQWVRNLIEDVEASHQQEALPLFEFLPWHNWREKRRFLKRKKEYAWPSWSQELQALPVELRAFFKAWIGFLSGNPIGFADAMQPFVLLSEENSSTSTVRGGLNELKNFFFEKIEYHGGTILREASQEYRLNVESSEIKGVEFEGYNFPTRCRYFLGNESFQRFISHVPKNLRTRRYHRQKDRPASVREYQIHFLTTSKVLPKPMCQDVLCIRDPSAPLLGDNYFQIQVIPLSQPLDENEDTLLKVSYSLQLAPTEGRVEFFEKQHEEIGSALRKLIPFSSGRLRRVFPLLQARQDDLFNNPEEDYTQFFEKAERTVRYPPSFNFPGLTTPYQNLFMLGPDQLGWLGLEGRLHSAMKAVDSIWVKEAKLRRLH